MRLFVIQDSGIGVIRALALPANAFLQCQRVFALDAMTSLILSFCLLHWFLLDFPNRTFLLAYPTSSFQSSTPSNSPTVSQLGMASTDVRNTRLKNPYTLLCMKEESILIVIEYSHDDRRTVCCVLASGGCGRSR